MDEVAELHADQLGWVLGSWKSITLKSAESFENRDVGSKQYSAYEASFHYIETATGRRYLEDVTDPEGDAVTKTSRYYTDASKSGMLLARAGAPTQQLTIKRAFGTEDKGQTNRPAPLNYLYVGLIPLPEALPQATYLGEKTTSGRICDVFVFAGEQATTTSDVRVYWLDRETSVPLRVEAYASEDARVKGHPLFVWAAKPVDGASVLGLPTSYRLTRYHAGQGNGSEVWFQVDGVVESITLDAIYPESTFWPEITPQTVINDRINNRYISASMPATDTTTAAVAEPIRASPQPEWTSVLSKALLPVGVALLIAVVIIKWRSR